MNTETMQKMTSDIADEMGYGISPSSIEITRDAWADWKSGWSSLGSVTEYKPSDLDNHGESVVCAMELCGAQRAKGETRRDIVVVDFGDFRGVALL